MIRHHTHSKRFALPARRGLTLVELLVAVTILVIMILAFGSILSQGQALVSKSQRMIRANAQASAVAQVFRRDVAAMTSDGFLYVGNDDTPALLFTAVGPYISHVESIAGLPPTANAAVISYNAALDLSASGESNKALCRKTHLLAAPPALLGGWRNKTKDVMRMNLSNIQMKTSSPVANPTSLVPTFTAAPAVRTLPRTIRETEVCWPILVANCKDIRVDYRMSGTTATWKQGDGTIWMAEDRDRPDTDPRAWPVALRLTFTLSGEPFQVVAPITR